MVYINFAAENEKSKGMYNVSILNPATKQLNNKMGENTGSLRDLRLVAVYLVVECEHGKVSGRIPSAFHALQCHRLHLHYIYPQSNCVTVSISGQSNFCCYTNGTLVQETQETQSNVWLDKTLDWVFRNSQDSFDYNFHLNQSSNKCTN